MTELYAEERRRPSWRAPLLLALVAAVAVVLWTGLRVGPAPEIEIVPALPGIGPRTPVRVEFAAPGRGLADLRVELVQGETVYPLAERSHTPRPGWKLWGTRTERDVVEVEVGGETLEGLREGEATLRAVASRAGAWFRRGEPATAEKTLPVKLRPPRLEVLSSLHYPAQGGAEVVVYRVSGEAARDGVRAGERWFPGYPLPGSGRAADGGERFCLFGVPFDLADASEIRLEAEDELGNRAHRAFVDRFLPRAYENDDIEISTRFMEKVVPEILSQVPSIESGGDLLESYLRINGELRRANAATLEALAGRSRPALLWSQPFLPMPNAKVMSAFADRRTYLFEGREVDRQDHLGFDLASVRRAPVPASNSGVVALAGYFGIYGNAVVIDHGYGLMSLYGHLSSVEVSEGQTVTRGQVVGRTGETGLAAGDHLHFTMLLHGLPVNPIEWWDADWIRNRIRRKLGDEAFSPRP